MVLADLKALAAQLGIKGTSGLRKGDLVSAIAAHQNSAAPAASRRTGAAVGTDSGANGAQNGTSLNGTSATSTSATSTSSIGTSSIGTNGHAGEPTLALDIDVPQRTRRRAAGRPEGAPSPSTAVSEPAPARPAEGSAASSNADAPPSPSGDRPPTTQVAATPVPDQTDGPAPTTRAAADPSAATLDSSAVAVADPSAVASPDRPVALDSSAVAAVDTSTAAAAPAAGVAQPGGNGAERHDRPSYDGEDGPRSSRRSRRNRRDRENRTVDGATDGPSGGNDAAAVRDPQNPPAGQGQNQGQSRDGQNRDGQAARNNGRDTRQDSSRQDANRPDNNRPDNRSDNRGQEGDDPDSRRGRRFRDRNRRTRDRFADAPPDTEVRDDDVLVPVAGIVDVLDSYAFIRTSGYLSGPNDVYVSLSQIRKNGLRRGDAVTGAVRAPRDGETGTRQKFNALVRLDSVNGQDPELAKDRPEFTKLTPLYPNERLRLETESHILTTRIIDLVMPVGKGQRALIVSPPKAGKTSILQAVANAITTNNPEVHLMVVLVDERPEEVTDMQRSVKGEVIASTFDRPPADHTMVAELSIERAKRLVEMGRDVVVLLDSITRLGRAYNLAAPASGRILSGGVDSTALFPPKRFLGAARNIEHGGSLTIFASALVETGSAGDTVIFEEFKGTGNAELKLDRRIADKRIFPAIDVDQSSTRKEDLLLSPDELAITVKLRRVLSALDSQQALELLLDRLRKTKSNVEFLMQVAKST